MGLLKKLKSWLKSGMDLFDHWMWLLFHDRDVEIGYKIGSVFGLVLVVIAGATLVYFMWNWLMPEFFGIKWIAFWQACGIVFLAVILLRWRVLSKLFGEIFLSD